VILREKDGRLPEQLETLGRYILRVVASPRPDLVALLTAEGPERPKTKGGWIVGSVGGGFYGQHYVEFVQIPEFRRIGEPVRIPFTTVDGIYEPCWSADGRFLIYGDQSLERICVIHVPFPEREEDGEKKP
jgi:hypothetical protein